MNLLIIACLLVLSLCYTECADVQCEANVQWYRTAQGNADRITKQSDLQFGEDFSLDQVVMVNRSEKYQSILGFGGAITDSASHVFSKLSATMQSQVLDMYFSENGLHYNMVRMPMGSCDFSLEHYDYASISGDRDLTHFSIDHDKAHIIPFIQQANKTVLKRSGEALNIVATPWSPPKWLKDNNSPYCLRGCHCMLKDQYKETWALYFSKFVSAYKAEGINIWGVTIQNQPECCHNKGCSANVREGMHFTPETERDFLKEHLGPRLSTDHPNLNILIYDDNKDRIVPWVQTILSDPEAAKYVWGTAIHWYTGDQFDNVRKAHDLFPQTPILATESTEGREKTPKNPKWGSGEHYGHDIIGDMNNWVVGFIDWNLILDKQGGPNYIVGPDMCEGKVKCGSGAMLLADTDKQIIYPQISYYYMGHFSKFTPRGSTRIFSSVENSSLECIAFLTPDNSVVVVVMNRGDNAVTFKLLDEYGGKEQALKMTALSHSIQTFVY